MKRFDYYVLSMIILGIASILFFGTAFAQTQQLELDLDLNKQELRDQQHTVIKLKRAIKALNLELDQAQEKTKTSWDAFTELKQIKQNINQTRTELNQERTILLSLLDERNKLKAELKNTLTKIQATPIKEPNFDSIKNKLIGIELSQSCLTLIKNNLSTTCPTYKELSILDTSLKQVSGDFVTKNGFYHRQNPDYNNSWQYYKYDKYPRLIVDPPLGMNDHIPMIEIRPNFDIYFKDENRTQTAKYEETTIKYKTTFSKQEKTITFQNKTQDYGRILYHDRYITNNCYKAAINADIWQSLILDTIHHIQRNCTPDSTNFKEIQIIYQNSTQPDLTTSKEFNYQQWLKDTIQNCIFKYKQC